MELDDPGLERDRRVPARTPPGGRSPGPGPPAARTTSKPSASSAIPQRRERSGDPHAPVRVRRRRTRPPGRRTSPGRLIEPEVGEAEERRPGARGRERPRLRRAACDGEQRRPRPGPPARARRRPRRATTPRAAASTALTPSARRARPAALTAISAAASRAASRPVSAVSAGASGRPRWRRPAAARRSARAAARPVREQVDQRLGVLVLRRVRRRQLVRRQSTIITSGMTIANAATASATASATVAPNGARRRRPWRGNPIVGRVATVRLLSHGKSRRQRTSVTARRPLASAIGRSSSRRAGSSKTFRIPEPPHRLAQGARHAPVHAASSTAQLRALAGRLVRRPPGRVLRHPRPQRLGQEHAAEDPRQHLPRRRRPVRIAGRVAPFIELGVGFNPELTARENGVLNGVLMGLDAARGARAGSTP